jgi:hypothetical protein
MNTKVYQGMSVLLVVVMVALTVFTAVLALDVDSIAGHRWPEVWGGGESSIADRGKFPWRPAGYSSAQAIAGAKWPNDFQDGGLS